MKKRASKLDPHAERIDSWVAENKTVAEIQAQLALDGVRVSTGRLSTFIEALAQSHLRERLFSLVATGGQMNRELDQAFAKNPAPELGQLIRVVKTLVMSLQLQGTANPEMLDLANAMLRTVVDYAKLETKREEVALAVKRVTQELKSDLEKALDAFAQELKGNPKLLEAYQRFRAEVNTVMAK